MWNGKTKALTFSYDDGVAQDVRLVEILNRYGMKCTFNLNSGLIGEERVWEYKGVPVRRLGLDTLREIYKGHEVAAHGLTHPFLERLPYGEAKAELEADKANLESWFGVDVKGMAYPFGTYSDAVVQAVGECGLRYARTVKSTSEFALPANPLVLNPTCHHDDPALDELADLFLNAGPEQPLLFYVWGHSYEFDGNKNWDSFERFCERVAGCKNVFYCTNAQAVL